MRIKAISWVKNGKRRRRRKKRRKGRTGRKNEELTVQPKTMSCCCHVKESWITSPLVKIITIIFSFSNENTINRPEPCILTYFEKSLTDGVAFTKICTYYHTNVTCGKFPDGFCIVKAINDFPKGMFFSSLLKHTYYCCFHPAWSLFLFSTCLPPGITLGSPPPHQHHQSMYTLPGRNKEKINSYKPQREN